MIFVLLGLSSTTVDARTPVAYIMNESDKKMYFDNVDDGALNIIRRDAYMYWEGKDVTDSGHTNNPDFYPDYPKWHKFSIIKEIHTVIFLENFADVKPVCTKGWFAGFESLKTIISLKYLNTSNVKTMSEMFENCESLTHLDMISFNTSNVTDMNSMFSGCKSLKNVSLLPLNTSKVTNMHAMFLWCESLPSLDLSSFNTSNVTDMSYMFNGCKSLEKVNLSSFNTSKVTDMSQMFIDCNQLKTLSVSNFNTANVTTMSQMFCRCESLESLDLSSFNTSNVGSMSNMFSSCGMLKRLDVSNFDTRKVQNMYEMFSECSSLKTLDVTSFRANSLKYMQQMFGECSNLTALDLRHFTPQNVSDASYMFVNCSKLRTILSSDTWSVGISDGMFANCFALVGAIKYDDNKMSGSYANPTTGYFSSYKTYPLTICGVTVDNLNCGDLTTFEGVGLRDPNGYASYDPDVFTLNLKSVYLTAIDQPAIKFQLGSIARFNINVEEGTSTVRASSKAGIPAIDLYNDTQIYGDGQLNVIGRSVRYGEIYDGYEVPAIVAHKDLVLFGVSVTARGTYGICGSTMYSGDGKISIFGYDYDHRVVAEGTKGSICNFKSSYITEQIQQPAGAKFSYNAVRLNDEIVKSEIIIGAPIVGTGIYIAGVEVNSVNSGDLSVISGVEVSEGGYMRYDWETNSLEMNGAKVSTDGIALLNRCKYLKIKVVEKNDSSLSAGGEAALIIEEPTTITNPGDGLLFVQSDMETNGKGILLRTDNGKLNVDDGRIYALGTYGICGDRYTYKNGSMMMVGYTGEVSVNGNSWIFSEGTYYDFGPLDNLTLGKNVHITEPLNATFEYNCVYYRNKPSNGIGVVIEYYNPGDVNEDGNVDISDVVAVINTIAGNMTYGLTADVNSDNNIDISDIVAIINIIAGGTPPPHPVPQD